MIKEPTCTAIVNVPLLQIKLRLLSKRVSRRASPALNFKVYKFLGAKLPLSPFQILATAATVKRSKNI